MLRDGSDNWNMDLCVSGIPEGVETTSPWSNDAANCQEDQASEGNNEYSQDEPSEECSELLAWHTGSDELDKSDQLKKAKNTYTNVRSG